MVDLGYLPREVGEEPFQQLRLHGWVLRNGAKMSKSRGNVVNPDEYVQQYGADVVRGYVLFMGSYTEGGDWRDSGILGIERFYRRLWEWISSYINLTSAPVLEQVDDDRAYRAVHQAIKKLSAAIPALSFNTAIATLMELLNVLRTYRLSGNGFTEIARTYVLLFAPIAPFLAEELWEQLGGSFSVHQQAWPAFDPHLAADETIVVPIQVNGKLRSRLEVSVNASEEAIRQAALASEDVLRHTADKRITNIIYVPGRLLNIVVR
jgi:leucyl-tRNA synthetase